MLIIRSHLFYFSNKKHLNKNILIAFFNSEWAILKLDSFFYCW